MAGTLGKLRPLARAGVAILALAGAVFAAAGLALALRADWREGAELRALEWLGERNPDAREVFARAAVGEAAHGSRLATLPKDQAAVASWLARKYRVGAEPLAALVAEAHYLGGHTRLEPLLLLAVMAIESNFNPYAQSVAGAQGLMQVVTSVHQARFARFGGAPKAFDPLVNLHVGAEILKECIALRGGSVEGGLQYYFGGGNVNDDNDQGYTARVLAEKERLVQVAAGATVPFQ